MNGNDCYDCTMPDGKLANMRERAEKAEDERDQYQSDWLSASATVVDYELEIDKLLELLEELQATAIVLRVELDEYIAYIGYGRTGKARG